MKIGTVKLVDIADKADLTPKEIERILSANHGYISDYFKAKEAAYKKVEDEAAKIADTKKLPKSRKETFIKNKAHIMANKDKDYKKIQEELDNKYDQLIYNILKIDKAVTVYKKTGFSGTVGINNSSSNLELIALMDEEVAGKKTNLWLGVPKGMTVITAQKVADEKIPNEHLSKKNPGRYAIRLSACLAVGGHYTRVGSNNGTNGLDELSAMIISAAVLENIGGKRIPYQEVENKALEMMKQYSLNDYHSLLPVNNAKEARTFMKELIYRLYEDKIILAEPPIKLNNNSLPESQYAFSDNPILRINNRIYEQAVKNADAHKKFVSHH